MRVKVVREPSDHATGDHSPKCTCRGRIGTVEHFTIEATNIRTPLVIVRFDKSGGRAGIPQSCLRVLKDDE
jgi:hypothetical protein